MENNSPEVDEAQLMARARALGLEIPASEKANVLKGVNHLLRLADVVRDFARAKDIPLE